MTTSTGTKRWFGYGFAGLLALILLAFATLWISGLTLDSRMRSHVKALAMDDAGLPTLATPSGLPAPVARFRAAALATNTPPIRGVEMALKGRLLLPGQTEFRDIEGHQYISALRPAFIWNVRMQAGPGWVEIADHYQDCGGSITSRAFSLYTILSERDVEELTLTQLTRWSGLAVLTGSGLTDPPQVTWHAVNDATAIAEVTDCGRTIRHTFYFDEQGHMVRSQSTDRYELYPDQGYVATGSVMHRLDYQTVDGLTLPTTSRIIRIEEGAREVEFLTEVFSDFRIHH